MKSELESLREYIKCAFSDDEQVASEATSEDPTTLYRFNVLNDSYRMVSKQVRNSVAVQMLLIALLFSAAAGVATENTELGPVFPIVGMKLPLVPFRIVSLCLLIYFWARFGYILDAAVKARLELLRLRVLDRKSMVAVRDHFFVDAYFLLFYPWAINPKLRWYSPARLLAIISFIVLNSVVLGLNNFLVFATIWHNIVPFSAMIGWLLIVLCAVVFTLTYSGFGISQYLQGEPYFLPKYVTIVSGVIITMVLATIANGHFDLHF